MITREMIMQAKEELKEYGIVDPTPFDIRDMVNALYPVTVDAQDIEVYRQEAQERNATVQLENGEWW